MEWRLVWSSLQRAVGRITSINGTDADWGAIAACDRIVKPSQLGCAVRDIVVLVYRSGPIMMVLDQAAVPPVVLVVEDEMLPRMRAIDLVEGAGYTSLEAVDADEALAVLESRSDIALLLTDIQMPCSMDGLTLAHAVHMRWPPIRIIVVSGQLKPANIDLPAQSRFLEKPLETLKILAQMRRLLSAPERC